MCCSSLKKLKEESYCEGYQEGYQEVDRELVCRWTKEGFSTAKMAELLKRTEDDIHQIQKEAGILE